MLLKPRSNVFEGTKVFIKDRGLECYMVAKKIVELKQTKHMCTVLYIYNLVGGWVKIIGGCGDSQL